MSNLLSGIFSREFLYILLVLATIAGALFAIFSFLASSTVSVALGLVLFVVVGGLLVAGYMFGLMFLGLALVPIAESVGVKRDQRIVTKSG